MIRICPLLKNNNLENFERILRTGYNGVRFNFSHINIELADKYVTYLRNTHPDIKIIQDLQGHKIRIGNIKDVVVVEKNTPFLIRPENIETNIDYIQIPILFENYQLLNNTSKFIIENKNSTAIISVLKIIYKNTYPMFICMSSSDIVFRKEKGINAIGFDRTELKLSSKDKKDVLWALENKADVVIYSFTSSAKQILELKEYIKSKSDYMPQIWAKIESSEGVKNIDEIISVCDGIMIGRGDMCVELPINDIPRIQDEIISKCKKNNKDCIIATYIFNNYKNKTKTDISDITALYYFTKMGATGFMPANEITFASNPYKISKDLNDYISKI